MQLMRWYQVGVLLGCLLCPVVGLTQVLSVTPSITVGERYDDNINQTDANKEDDFVTIITPGIELRYAPSRETEVNFSYRPSFEIFANNSDENQLAHKLSLGGQAQLTRRFSLSVNDQLSITEEPDDRLREVTAADGTRGVSDQGRQRTIRNTADVVLRFRLAPRSTIALLYSNLVEDVDDPFETDEVRNTAGLELGYLTDIARRNRVFVSYKATVFNFTSNGGPEEDDFQVHTSAVGYEHHLTPTLTVTARIGYSFSVDKEEGTGGQDTGVVGGLELEKLLRTGSASLGYERSLTSGGGSGGQVLSDRLVGQLRTNLTPKIATVVGANVTWLDFQADADDDEDRVFYTIRPGITYQALRVLQVFTDYVFSRTDYNDSTRSDRTDHRVSVGARLRMRTSLSLSLVYEYRTRTFDNQPLTDDRSFDEFTRNLVTLSLTYGPTFRF